MSTSPTPTARTTPPCSRTARWCSPGLAHTHPWQAYRDGNATLLRFTGTGRLDDAFGAAGVSVLQHGGPGADETAESVVVDPRDGALIFAGAKLVLDEDDDTIIARIHGRSGVPSVSTPGATPEPTATPPAPEASGVPSASPTPTPGTRTPRAPAAKLTIVTSKASRAALRKGLRVKVTVPAGKVRVKLLAGRKVVAQGKGTAGAAGPMTVRLSKTETRVRRLTLTVTAGGSSVSAPLARAASPASSLSQTRLDPHHA